MGEAAYGMVQVLIPLKGSIRMCSKNSSYLLRAAYKTAVITAVLVTP